jgi:hypothetical protein
MTTTPTTPRAARDRAAALTDEATAAELRAAALAAEAAEAAELARTTRNARDRAARDAGREQTSAERAASRDLADLARALAAYVPTAGPPAHWHTRDCARWLLHPIGSAPHTGVRAEDVDPPAAILSYLAGADPAMVEAGALLSRTRDLAHDLGADLGPEHELTGRAFELEAAAWRARLARLAWLAGELAPTTETTTETTTERS